ncbi:shugoshin [Drosophila elegans]|uniref:shugoshin n=1 Tax=Drosophila elegans TaxID=30023 RepID=UPI0007E777F7|nr:shugoshin [Drosophila elegans]
MGTKIEQQYKLLNAELMEQVQKQRLEIGEYRKRMVALERENMDLREEHVLQNDRQRIRNISIVRDLMQRLNVENDCLAERQEPPDVPIRPSGQRRSSKEICRDMRQTISLARTTRTISPTRTNSMDSTISPTSRRSSATVHAEVEATKAPENCTNNKYKLEPRKPTELMFDEDESGEDSSYVESPVHKQCDKNQETETDGSQQNDRLFSIIEECASDDDTSEASSSSEAIYCDTTIEGTPPKGNTPATPCGRALREIDTNVLEAVTLSKRKETVKFRLNIPGNEEDSVQEQSLQLAKSRNTVSENEEDSVQEPSIQLARLAVPRPSHSSGISPDFIGSTPRQSRFNGICQVAGSTSTPKSFRIEELPSKKTRNRTTVHTKSEQTEMSSTFFSTSGRPNRSCRPTSLVEPSLRNKLRNGNVKK